MLEIDILRHCLIDTHSDSYNQPVSYSPRDTQKVTHRHTDITQLHTDLDRETQRQPVIIMFTVRHQDSQNKKHSSLDRQTHTHLTSTLTDI